MRYLASAPRRLVGVSHAALALAIAGAAHATPPGAAAPRRTLAVNRPTAPPPPRSAARTPPPPPAPPPAPPTPVALQLSGLQVTIPVSRAAVLHALARDVWPRLVACANRAPRARGYTTVEITEMQDELEVRLRGGPAVRDTALASCVQQAVGAVVLPPYEGEAPPTSVAFDLAFNMPPVATPRRARR